MDSKSTQTNNSNTLEALDCISRQAAIDAMLGDKVQITNVIRAIGNERDFEVLNCTCDRHAEIIKALPPVQAEPLTDREQRIFLAAMSREKEVCKEADYQLSDAREPYEDTLVSVCKKIERKVKAALWTN